MYLLYRSILPPPGIKPYGVVRDEEYAKEIAKKTGCRVIYVENYGNAEVGIITCYTKTAFSLPDSDAFGDIEVSRDYAFASEADKIGWFPVMEVEVNADTERINPLFSYRRYAISVRGTDEDKVDEVLTSRMEEVAKTILSNRIIGRLVGVKE